MKNMLLGLLLVTTSHVFSCPGCMDNSWHLQRPFDTKEYHPVECNCPCRKLNIARGECTECGHKHFFEEQIIIRRPKPENAQTSWRKIPHSICQ